MSARSPRAGSIVAPRGGYRAVGRMPPPLTATLMTCWSLTGAPRNWANVGIAASSDCREEAVPEVAADDLDGRQDAGGWPVTLASADAAAMPRRFPARHIGPVFGWPRLTRPQLGQGTAGQHRHDPSRRKAILFHCRANQGATDRGVGVGVTAAADARRPCRADPRRRRLAPGWPRLAGAGKHQSAASAALFARIEPDGERLERPHRRPKPHPIHRR